MLSFEIPHPQNSLLVRSIRASQSQDPPQVGSKQPSEQHRQLLHHLLPLTDSLNLSEAAAARAFVAQLTLANPANKPADLDSNVILRRQALALQDLPNLHGILELSSGKAEQQVPAPRNLLRLPRIVSSSAGRFTDYPLALKSKCSSALNYGILVEVDGQTSTSGYMLERAKPVIDLCMKRLEKARWIRIVHVHGQALALREQALASQTLISQTPVPQALINFLGTPTASAARLVNDCLRDCGQHSKYVWREGAWVEVPIAAQVTVEKQLVVELDVEVLKRVGWIARGRGCCRCKKRDIDGEMCGRCGHALCWDC